jgi:hypothetical protein
MMVLYFAITGVKVAAVAVGVVVLGALTAGVGLVPYITVVGITAMAGGGAVALQLRKPSDSRLILACENMSVRIVHCAVPYVVCSRRRKQI